MVAEQTTEGYKLSGTAPAVSPAEIRRRRLEALEGTSAATTTTTSLQATVTQQAAAAEHHEEEDSDQDAHLQAALALSLQRDEVQETTPTTETQECWKSAGPFDVASFHSIMWDSQMTTDSDKSRWLSQGIDVRDKMQVDDNEKQMQDSMLALVGSNHGPWGLTQAHGGPCGVLAAVQAEMLRLLLFGKGDPLQYPTESGEDLPAAHVISDELVKQAMAMSIAIIIARASLMPPAATPSAEDAATEKRCARIVLPTPNTSSYSGLTWEDLEPWSASTLVVAPPKLQVYTIVAPSASNLPKRQKTNETMEDCILHLANAISTFLLHGETLEYFRKPGGVILLTISLVCSRGSAIISSDMDDPYTKLTSQFGHCGQELMNLLLTGQAVSNVFDNTLTPSGALTCRGVQSRPAIGYLSQLEAMRYCEVGGYYKNPFFPIWVVGSTSHFTVLFGDPSCLKESKSDALLEQCRRAFKSIEGGEENGYISTASLPKVFSMLELDVGGDSAIQTLGATMEVSGAGIILWDDFWKAASRLLTGASVESVLQGTDSRPSSASSDQMPPLLLTEFGNDNDLDRKPAAKVTTVESDEEMARRLAEEWGSPSSPSAAARPASPMDMDPSLSDEALARRLQAEWDSEVSGTASVDAVTGSPSVTLHGDAIDLDDADEETLPPLDQVDTKMSATPDTKLDFEKFGNSFHLYHYNGLRGGSLTPFRVTRLTAEEAVGTSVALSNSAHAGASGGVGEKGPGAGAGDLEDVVRTKWPSCIIDWLGKQPPYID